MQLSTASFSGELQDFYDFIGPKIRNDIATMTKKRKIELGYICQICNKKNELDAAHRHGRERNTIIENLLEPYKNENGVYTVLDMRGFQKTLLQAHLPLEDNFLFLCKSCHREYDSKNQNNSQTKKTNTLSQEPKQTLKQFDPKIIPQREEEFTEQELYETFKVRNTGGIRPTTQNKAIILINSFFSEQMGGYENEIKEEEGYVYHVGEGPGYQEMKRNNKSLLESKQNGYALLYFDKPSQNKLEFKFPVEYDSWKRVDQKDSDGKSRKAILFKLKILND